MNPAKTGTKAAAHYILEVPAGGSQLLSDCVFQRTGQRNAFGRISTRRSGSRIADADEFYDRITPAH